MTPGDEMLDAADPEQIVAEAFVESVYGRGVYGQLHPSTRAMIDKQYAKHAAALLAALQSNGVLVFSSEADVWAFVRERVLLSDEVMRVMDEAFRDGSTRQGLIYPKHAGDREWLLHRVAVAALDAAERGTDA